MTEDAFRIRQVPPLATRSEKSKTSADSTDRIQQLLTESVVWDNHACLPQTVAPVRLEGLRRYAKSGVTCIHINIGDADASLAMQIQIATAYRGYIAQYPDEYLLAQSIEDVVVAKATGRLAVCFDVEGAYAVGEQLSTVRLYRNLGVRWILLVYNRTNLVGGGCHETVDEGLTPFGRKFAAELDKVGIVKDCSHTGYRTAFDVIETSDLPVNFSHSNPRALCDHPRNIPDDLIRGCARTGGVVGISGVGIFLGDNDNRTQTIVRHIDYVAQLVGPEHVGLGLDYTILGDSESLDVSARADFWPPGYGYQSNVQFVEPERIPAIVQELARLGYGDSAIKGILGANFMRVAARVWK